MSRGSLYAANGEHANALASFAVAERDGYNLYNLPFQRGLTLAALGQAPAAYEEFKRARAMNPPSPTRELVLLQMGRLAMQLGRADEAVALLDQLLTAEPANAEARYSLAMALVMKKDFARAKETADQVVARNDSARARYVRALAGYGLGRKAEALADIEAAIRIAGENPHLVEWRGKIQAMK